MKIRRTLLWGIPVLILVLVAYFFYAELTFQRQEEAFQNIRQKGWTLYLAHEEGDGYASCGGGRIIIDQMQRIWVASQCHRNGIHVFDGTQWTTYSPHNSELHSQAYGDLAVDLLGQIWTIDDNAAVVFDGTTWTSSLQLDRCTVGTIESLDADNRGAIWIFIFNGCASSVQERSQVRVMQNGIWTTFNPGDLGLPNENLDREGFFHGWNGSIDIDADGTAQITTQSGIFVFNGKSWQPVSDQEDNLKEAKGITDNQGRVWTWSSDNVQVRDNSGLVILSPENSGLAGEEIYDLAIDDSGRIWIGNEEGVSMFSGGEIEPVLEQLVNQRYEILEKRESTNGYSWFLPSALAALWLAAFLNVLPGVLIALVLGLLFALPFGPPIIVVFGQAPNPGVVATYCGILGGILGGLIDKGRGTRARSRWAIGLALAGVVLGFGIAFLLVFLSI